MVSVPFTSTTSPVSVRTCLTSSTWPLRAVMTASFSESAFSACATPIMARENTVNSKIFFIVWFPCFILSFCRRDRARFRREDHAQRILHFHHAGGVIGLHADAIEARGARQDIDRHVRFHSCFIRE